jgi:hypothetical protein
LNVIPTLPNTFFKVASPQSGQTVKASSVKAWTMSNWWLHDLQRYS